MRKLRVAKRPRRSPPQRVLPLPAPGGIYLPSHEQLCRIIAMKGATDEEIELVYGLGTGTLRKWREVYPGLNKAVEQGRTAADGEVLYSMFKTATGYQYEEEQAVGGRSPVVMKVKRHYPGQFLAQKHWLANRKRDEWPASEKVEISGRNGEPIKVESRNELIDAIVALIASKADPEKTRDKEQRAT